MPKIKFSFINKTENKIPSAISPKIKKNIFKLLNLIKYQKNIEINIFFVGKKEIQKLNKRYLNKNIPTDVLSFVSNIPVAASKVLGDIVICPNVAEENAKKSGQKFDKEIIVLALHGALHLIGYNHKNNLQKKKWAKIFKKFDNNIK